MSRLKSEYPEITTEEQGSMDQLRRLCRETPEIGLAEEERLLDFKRKFFFIVQKCLKPPAITGNRVLRAVPRRQLQGSLELEIESSGSSEGGYAGKELCRRSLCLRTSNTEGH